MMRWLALIAVTVTACSPPPREVSWFEAHAETAQQVVNGCAAGARDRECENAQTALKRIKANARMERYRKGFE